MYRFLLLLLFMNTCGIVHVEAQSMNLKKMDRILIENVDSLDKSNGQWKFNYKGVKMMIVVDNMHNRFRMVSPIIYVKEVKSDYLFKALEANFYTVLDVKYAISEGIIWTVFIHPFKELSENQLTDALEQMQISAKTFGTTYSSGNLIFR